jgi:hypothetical protein
MIEAPRAKTAAQEWRWKQSNACSGKDDDCAQNNGFNPCSAVCLSRRKEKLGSCRMILDNEVYFRRSGHHE